MAIDFPSSPADNTLVSGYTARSSQWRDIRGRAESFNRIVNGAMQVSQINGLTSGTVDGLILADMYDMVYVSSTVGGFQGQRVNSPTPKGSTARLRVTINTPDTTLVSGENLRIGNVIEGIAMTDLKWGTANAIPVVFRFGWRSPVGTYSVALRNSATTRSYVMWWTISAGQANTDTEQVFAIPGDITGAWANDTARFGWFDWSIAGFNTMSVGLAFSWQAGNFTRVPQTNGIGTAGNVFELFDVGLYADPNYTGLAPEWELPDEGVERRRCQRHLCIPNSFRGIVGTATQVFRYGAMTMVPMRVAPTAAIKSSPQLFDGTAFPVITSIIATYSTPLSHDIDVTCAAGGLSATRQAGQYYTNVGADHIRAWADI